MKHVHRPLGILVTLFLAMAGTMALVLPVPSFAAEEPLERVLVRFKPGQQRTIAQAAKRQGGQIHYEFEQLNTIAVSLPASAIEGLRHNPNVVQIEPDAPRYPADQVVPYGVENVEARALWDANLDGQLDPGTPNGAGRTVCVIDSGVNVNHEDLAGLNFVGGYPSGWNTDTCGHGTHVLGTIAAMNNGSGVVGVTPGTVALYVVKIYGDGCAWAYSSTLVDAAYRCRDAGANIINMSLAGAYYSSFEDAAFRDLYNQGILSVAAAGNQGGTAYAYPASYDSVISVGAVDQNNVVASFSRQNDKVELVGPGVFVYSTTMDGGYAYMSGTSSSTPHVAAAAAVAWSANPAKSNVEVRQALQQTALDLGAAGRDNAYGFGLVQTKHASELIGAIPTGVDLVRFEAAFDGSAIRLEWETATEVDNLGFNVYRAESPDGPRTRLNAGLIPSQAPGSAVGATYEFVDESATPGATYSYWLEDVDTYGSATLHGPVSAQLALARRLLPARTRPDSAAPALGGH